MIIENTIKSVKNCEQRGLWLEAFCPEDRCLREEERIQIVDFCADSEEHHDLWQSAFCPEKNCEIFEASALP
jgi:hypothetical protein